MFKRPRACNRGLDGIWNPLIISFAPHPCLFPSVSPTQPRPVVTGSLAKTESLDNLSRPPGIHYGCFAQGSISSSHCVGWLWYNLSQIGTKPGYCSTLKQQDISPGSSVPPWNCHCCLWYIMSSDELIHPDVIITCCRVPWSKNPFLHGICPRLVLHIQIRWKFPISGNKHGHIDHFEKELCEDNMAETYQYDIHLHW